MSESFKALLVEDDPLIAKSLQLSLPYNGFSVTICVDCKSGRQALKATSFDIVLLDVNLPDGNGLDLCREIRDAKNDVPILMLTAKLDEATALRGFESGADDHIRKPYGVNELVARMKRLVEKRPKGGQELRFLDLRIEIAQHRAYFAETQIHLGKREFDILTLLVKRQGEAVTRNEILDAVGHDADVFDRTIDSHLSHLRRKLKDAGAVKIQITAVYGVGYRLEKSTAKPEKK